MPFDPALFAVPSTLNIATALARQPALSTLGEGLGCGGVVTGTQAEVLAQWLTHHPQPVVVDRSLYTQLDGAAQALLKRSGLTVLDTRDLAAVRQALEGAGSLLAPTVQEPWQTFPDRAGLAQVCEQAGAALLLDSTATPLLQWPARASFLQRHSRLLLGDVAADEAVLLSQIGETQTLPASSLATLPSRLRMHSGHAQAAADILAGHPQVRAVYFAGLSTHPQFEWAAQIFPEGFGGLLALEPRQPERFAQRLAWSGAAQWGGPQSCCWAATGQVWQLWLGLEDIDDLLGELEAALE